MKKAAIYFEAFVLVLKSDYILVILNLFYLKSNYLVIAVLDASLIILHCRMTFHVDSIRFFCLTNVKWRKETF